MLVNLRTIHKPESYQEAITLLDRPHVYPLYGHGASLVRLPEHNEIEEVVDLSHIIGQIIELDEEFLFIETGATLQQIADFAAPFKLVIDAEYPETLRNVLTLGDVLLEGCADSLLLAFLFALQAEPNKGNRGVRSYVQLDQLLRTMHEHYIGRHRLWRSVGVPHWSYVVENNVQIALEKVARTPKDRPIVAAIGVSASPYESIEDGVVQGEPFAVVTGIADYPAHYTEGIESTVDNYQGSAKYRTEMARVLSQRAIARAVALAEQ